MLINQVSESFSKNLNLTQNSASVQAGLKLLVGQQLSVNVLQVAGSSVKLDVAGAQVLAQTSLPLMKGQTLLVKVSELGGQVQLNINRPADSAQDLNKSLLRQLLPQSMVLSQVFSMLTSAQMQASLPAAVQAQINLILNQLLRMDSRLGASNLKQAVEQSGMFFESGIVNKRAHIGRDLKAQLFKLQSLLTENSTTSKSPTIAQALGLVGQAISQISLGQFQHVFQPETLNLSLPFMVDGEVEDLSFKLRSIAQDEKRWVLTFSTQLGDEPVSCRLDYYQNEHVFDCTLNIESKAGMALLEQNTEYLESLFEGAGLVLKRLNILQGLPAQDASPLMTGLIDVKA